MSDLGRSFQYPIAMSSLSLLAFVANVVFLLFCAVYLAGLIVAWFELRRAPIGFEDESGFHLGRDLRAEDHRPAALFGFYRSPTRR